jgi:hypothetical protein
MKSADFYPCASVVYHSEDSFLVCQNNNTARSESGPYLVESVPGFLVSPKTQSPAAASSSTSQTTRSWQVFRTCAGNAIGS